MAHRFSAVFGLKPPGMKSIALFIWMTFVSIALAQDYPGGPFEIRPVLTAEQGSHPRILVQTVSGATTTATCLVLRYAEPGKRSPSPGAAHLLEHLLYRTSPDGKPGGQLVRNEIQGHQARGWITSSELVLSEEVPAEEGLASLSLQLARLKGVPTDPQGLKLEKRIIGGEIDAASNEVDKARRDLLKDWGLNAEVEGTREALHRMDESTLESVLADLSLQEDVVIAVIGPHTQREVRSHLAKALAPLKPSRQGPRETGTTGAPKPQSRTVKSPKGYHQKSLFFSYQLLDPRVPNLASTLLKQQLPAGSEIRIHREAESVYRLDLFPADLDISVALTELTPEKREALLNRVRRDWLERFESPQERAEMMALSVVRGFQPREPVQPAELGTLVKQAHTLIKAASKGASLTLEPVTPADGRAGLYPFRDRAYFTGGTQIETETLPNGLHVTVQKMETWPVVAVSGFFRLTPSLSPGEVNQLQSLLEERAGSLKFEVKNDAVFFHAWDEASRLPGLLKQSSGELQALATENDLLAEAPPYEPGVLESFFLLRSNNKGRKLKGEKIFNPQNGHLVITGALDTSGLDQGLRPAWSGWFGSDRAAPVYAASPEEGDSEKPAVSRTVKIGPLSSPVIVVGFSGPNRSSPNFLPFNLALQTLAGRPTTSILARSLTDSGTPVSSVKLFPLTASDRGESQTWLVALRLETVPETADSVAEEVKEQLKELAQRPLAKADLARTRSYLKNSLTLSASSVQGRAGVLAHAEFHRLSQSYAQDFAGLYDHLNPDLVKSVCKEYFSEPEIRWVYFKPGK